MEGLEGITITSVFGISYAHRLPNSGGRCERMHGHNSAVEIELDKGATQEDGYPGQIVDNHTLQDCVKPLLKVLDFGTLNEILPEECQPPTCEHITAWLVSALLETEIGPGLLRVRITETPKFYAEWRRPCCKEISNT